MDKQKLIERARSDYRTGFYAWHDIKRNYPALTTNEIFLQVIGFVKCSMTLNKQTYTTKKPND